MSESVVLKGTGRGRIECDRRSGEGVRDNEKEGENDGGKEKIISKLDEITTEAEIWRR